MLIINRVTLIKGDSKESINKGPIALEIMNVEQFSGTCKVAVQVRQGITRLYGGGRR